MTLKERFRFFRKAFTRKTTELQRELKTLKNHVEFNDRINADNFINIDKGIEELGSVMLDINRRLIALEGKEPEEKPAKTKIRSLADLKALIESNRECLQLACVLYAGDSRGELYGYAARKMQGIIIANSDTERHPSWGNGRHWDALYIPELKVIIDWIQGAKLGGRIIDKLQWLEEE